MESGKEENGKPLHRMQDGMTTEEGERGREGERERESQDFTLWHRIEGGPRLQFLENLTTHFHLVNTPI